MKTAIPKNTMVKDDDFFESSLDHILVELRRIGLKLQLCVKRMSDASTKDNEGQFRGLYVTETDLESILDVVDPACRLEHKDTKDSAEILERLEKSITARKKEALGRGLELRLDNLQHLFGLSQFEIDTLLCCLLPEVDIRYQRLFAYLQDDITKRSPTVGLLLDIFCDSLKDKLKTRELFSCSSPLITNQLIHLYDDHSATPALLQAKYVQLDERIVDYLLDIDQIDSRLAKFATFAKPVVKLQDLVLAENIKSRLAKLSAQFKHKGMVGYLFGTDEARKHLIVEAVSSELGVTLISIDFNSILTADMSVTGLMPLIFREGRLQNATIYFSDFETLISDEKTSKQIFKAVLAELKSYPFWVFLSGLKDWQAKEIFGSKPYFSIEVSTASYVERTQTWKSLKEGPVIMSPDVNIIDLAGKFRFTSGQISDAIAMACNLAKWRDPDNGIVTNEDLYSACRQQSREALSTLAHKIQPNYNWNDIILPPDQMSQLHEIANYVAHYHKVYSEWGFGRKISSGKGLNVLFAGSSGTGKTMAAEVIAHELGIDLYKIDLSGIVSKYIGETEKNLDHIFRDAQTSNAILFFDEADALFGKRSEVRDSHDRYANIEVAYLLQKMDEYDGIVILATNLRKNMDEAFARRMHYTLEFPVPEEADRLRIWQNIFPQEAPLSSNLDLKFMAKQFKITGGNIKNIALNAAFLATQDGGVIGTEHLIQSTKREYQKIGKLCTEGDFAKYYELVKG